MEKRESEKTTASSLIFDVLVAIFRCLDTDGKGKAAQVCTSWEKAANSKSLWKTLKIKLQTRHLNMQSEHSIIKRGITRVDMDIFEPKFYEFLRRIPSLEHLRFTGCCVTENMLKFFKTRPNSAEILKLISEVKISANCISNHVLECAALKFPSFHKLNPYGCLYNTGRILKTLTSGMRNLKILELDGCVKDWSLVGDLEFDNDTAEVNSKDEDQLMSLQDLHLRNAPFLKEETFVYISKKFVNLKTLKVELCARVSDVGLVHLLQLKNLEALSFPFSGGINDEALKHISQLTNLTSLNLSYCNFITDSGLALISRLTNLKYLNLRRCAGVTDDTLKQINGLLHLQDLDVHSCEISDEGLLNLVGGNLKLTRLDISCISGIGDQGLLYISQSLFACVLYYLNLSGCKFTDDGIISVIEKFSGLKYLFLGSCPSITDECRKRIAEMLPHLSKSFRLRSFEYDPAILHRRFDKLCSRLKPLADSII